MGIVAVIPARGGSKGIPRKNVTELAGKPLIAYSIEAARHASTIDRLIVSTDDSEIAKVSIALGAIVPFLRPSNLANDEAPMLGVLQHALDWLELEMKTVEALVLLQPTSPLRVARHVDEAVKLFRSTAASSVVSVVQVPHQYNPVSIMKLSDNNSLIPYISNQCNVTRRQDKPIVYARNGPAILVCHPDTIRAGDLYGPNCRPYVMPEDESLDVDSPEDLVRAQNVLLERRD